MASYFKQGVTATQNRQKIFLIEAPPEDNRKEVGRKTDTELEETKPSCELKLYTDGASRSDGSCVRFMLIDPEEDSKESRKIIIKVPHYKLITSSLYKKSFYTPWLRCIAPPKTNGVIKEIHEGSYGFNTDLRSMVVRII
uniref:Reverse transcriptase domain-containing protein n=1 Tax=Tanacetum cinerariifolium TaxID=118510 RepID=A0A6L2KIG4_TANCI|nr:reverse transcriptase domain-containing protein [Tanacetum cinerariifolium]